LEKAKFWAKKALRGTPEKRKPFVQRKKRAGTGGEGQKIFRLKKKPYKRRKASGI